MKTLVIRIITELVEYGHKLDEKMKAMLSEIKENIQGTNSEREETKTQINNLEQKEEITFNQNRMKKQELNKKKKKKEEGLRNFQDNFKRSNHRITGVPERDEEEQQVENLFEKNNKRELP